MARDACVPNAWSDRMKLKSKAVIISAASVGMGGATSLLFGPKGARVAAMDLVPQGIL